jgi:hypothetical protein
MRDLSAMVDQPGKRSDAPLWRRWRNEGWNRNRCKHDLAGLTDDELKELRRLCMDRAKAEGIMRTKAQPPTDHQRIDSSVKDGVWTIDGRGRISSLGQLLDRAEVDTDRWYVESWRANAYEAQRAGGGVVQLWQVKASLREHPAWVWSPVKPRQTFERVQVADPDVTLVIPDSQNGYRWVDRHSRLEPLHDRRAWDIAVQVAALLKPARIVLLGDMVDYAEGSKRWPVTPDLRATTQPTIEELHWWLAQLRETCPLAEIVYLEGNHEDRIDRALLSGMPELVNVTPAGEDRPLVTWRRLLALEALGIDYVGPYGERVTLHDDCEAHHGSTVASGGAATVARMLKGAHVSQIVGHIHRREYGCRTVWGPRGPRTIFAASPGTLCRVDGVVPAVHKRVDWQQGLAVLTWDGKRTSCQVIPIDDGAAYVYGERVEGADRGAEISRAVDWPQIA